MTNGLLPRTTVYKKAKDYVTFYYETSHIAPQCYGINVGNFDGAGLSFGIIQFNIKSGTVQPIWNYMIDNHPIICKDAFNNDMTAYNEWVDVVKRKSISEQIAWADSISIEADGWMNKRELKGNWNTYFYQLGTTPECIERQDLSVQPYLDLGEAWKNKYGLWSRRGFLLCFDIAVQSGGIPSSIDELILTDIEALDVNNLSKKQLETEKMKIIAQRRSEDPKIQEEFRTSYRDRKMAIALGSGSVYGTFTNTELYDMTLEPAFDYDVEYPPFPAIRYIRDWIDGNNVNANNYWNEIQVITTDGVNLAQGKPISSNGNIINSDKITDGDINSFAYEWENSGAKYIEIDLGMSYRNIKQIEIHHFYQDGRKFFGSMTEVSNNGTDWITLRNSALNGEYIETSKGLILKSNSYPVEENIIDNAFPPFRYVRDWLHGNSVNTNNYWNEISVLVNEENIAKGLPVTSNGDIINISNITDGDNSTYAYEYYNSGAKYVQIDLGKVRNDVNKINVVHYYLDERIFYGTRTEISKDGLNWITLYDSDYLGTYAETIVGKTYEASVLNDENKEPKASIVGITLTKLSDEPDFQKSILAFRFNTDVNAYSVRCFGVNHETGIDVESDYKNVINQARYTVKQASENSVREFVAFPAYTNIEAEIDYTELYQEGENRINIYGRNLKGSWTKYQA